jgi:hypothetical protein
MTSILDRMAITNFTVATGEGWWLTSDEMKQNENISCGGLGEACDLTTEKHISSSCFTGKQQCTGEELLEAVRQRNPGK